MRRRLRPFAALAASALVAGAAAASAGAAASLTERADGVVQQATTQADFNGAVVLMRDGVVVYERAVGLAQRKPDRPFTADTPSDGG